MPPSTATGSFTPELVAQKRRAAHLPHPPRLLAKLPRRMTSKCADCGKEFDPRPSGRGPSRQRCPDCGALRKRELVRARTAYRRAANWGVKAEFVMAADVFDRDNWKCHICGQQIPEQLRTGHALPGRYEPLAPVIDHKVALSRGGSHTLENCYTAHWACNARKHNAPHTLTEIAVQMELSGETDVVDESEERGCDKRTRSCRASGCGRPAWVKQLCRSHYHRLNRYGDPLKATCGCGCGEVVTIAPSWVGLFYIDGHGVQTNTVSVADRLSQNVESKPVSERGRTFHHLADDCLIWTGPKSSVGYGRMYVKVPGRKRKGRVLQVHRAAYELAHGEGSASGLTIDHLCGVPLCCNPNHLEAVALAENLKRAAAVIAACPQGHLYDEVNTLFKAEGHRICRQCNRNRYHVKKFGHDFVTDPLGTSRLRQRCRICREIRESQPAFCPYGHEYTPENKLLDNKGKRLCLQCRLNRTHLPEFGHEFVPDPANPSTKRRRCLTCVTNAPAISHCINGHEYTDASTEFTKKGHRRCVICRLSKKHLPDHGHEYVIDPDSPPKKRRCLVCHER